MTDLRALLARAREYAPAALQVEIDDALAKAPRATRIPADWRPDADLLTWAMKERPDLSITGQVESFKDYFLAKAGKDGCKLDWRATFRNWIRNARAVYKPAVPEPKQPSPAQVVRVRKVVDTTINPRVQEMMAELAKKLRIPEMK